MNISYQHTLTLGEVVTIIIGLIALIPLLIGFCVWLRRKKYPISMAYRGARGKYQRTCRCTKGRRLVEIRLSTHSTAQLRLIDIRFVERHWFFRWKDAPVDAVEIIDVERMNWGDDAQPFTNWNANLVGGFRCVPRQEKQWIAGHFLYLDLAIAAHKAWRGHLSFEATADSRLYARRPFVVLADAPPF